MYDGAVFRLLMLKPMLHSPPNKNDFGMSMSCMRAGGETNAGGSG